MTKRIAALCLGGLACAAALAWALVAAAAPEAGGQAGPVPLLHWSFDDPKSPGSDDSGHAHYLNIPGKWTSVAGPCGKAIRFEGYGSGHGLIDGPNLGPAPMGPFTPTANLKYPGDDGFSVAYWILAQREGGTWVADYWQHRAAGETFGLEFRGAQRQVAFFVRTGFNDPAPIVVVPLEAEPGEWLHLAGVYDAKAGVIQLYLNGEFAKEEKMPAPMRHILAPFLYANGSWHNTHPATIDDVRLYDVPLSAAQVRALFKLGVR